MRQWALIILAVSLACCSEPRKRDAMIDLPAELATYAQPTCVPPRQRTPGHAVRETARRTALAAIQDLEPTATPIVVRGLAVQRTHFDDGDHALAVYVLYRGTTSSGKAVATRGIVTTDASGTSVRKVEREPVG